MPDLSALWRRPWVADGAISLVCFLAIVTVPVKAATVRWWLVPLALVASVPLIGRRRYPIAVAAVVGAGTVGLALTGGLNDVALPYGQLVATYTFVSLSTPVWRLLGLAGTATGIVALGMVAGQRPSIVGLAALPFAAAYALGAGARARRDRISMLEERTHRLAEAHAAAASRERERIARETHDVLAHSVSLMVVQAEAGPVVVRTDPVRAEAALAPDVVLMDVRMAGVDGIEATAAICARTRARVLVLTTFDVDEYVYDALRAGASGFLLKDIRRDDLVEAVRVVAGGEALLAPTVTRRLIADVVGRSRRGPAGDPRTAARLAALTARETDTLRHLARGLSNAEIAAELYVSEHTVKTHVSNLLAKLGLRDRVQAVVLAFESGLVVPGGAAPQ